MVNKGLKCQKVNTLDSKVMKKNNKVTIYDLCGF